MRCALGRRRSEAETTGWLTPSNLFGERAAMAAATASEFLVRGRRKVQHSVDWTAVGRLLTILLCLVPFRILERDRPWCK